MAAFDNFYFSGKFSSLQTVVNSQGHFIPRFLVYQISRNSGLAIYIRVVDLGDDAAFGNTSL